MGPGRNGDNARGVKRGERGATALEFAVLASLFLVLLFGIMEFAFIFLQEHFVANAAREGVRIGVRANNYDCYKGQPIPGFDDCNIDLESVVKAKVQEYLGAFGGLYNSATIVVANDPADPDDDLPRPVLSVAVSADNFFPELLSGLVPGFAAPSTFAYTAIESYEDPEEFVPDP